MSRLAFRRVDLPEAADGGTMVVDIAKPFSSATASLACFFNRDVFLPGGAGVATGIVAAVSKSSSGSPILTRFGLRVKQKSPSCSSYTAEATKKQKGGVEFALAASQTRRKRKKGQGHQNGHSIGVSKGKGETKRGQNTSEALAISALRLIAHTQDLKRLTGSN